MGQWGLSILVESDESSVLLDAGAGITGAHNMDRLNIDTSKISKIVLSHGHSDHTGGLRDLLKTLKKEIEIIAHPDVWCAKHNRRKGKKEQYIGIPFQRLELEKYGAKFNLTAKPVKITENIITTGEIPMITEFEKIDEELIVLGDNGFHPDSVLDDQALIVSTSKGLVVVLGCAHRGIINTLYHARKLTGVGRIHMVIGGCHLIRSSEERMWQTIAALKELEVEKMSFCHCTGMGAITVMAQEFGENYIFNGAGTIIEVKEN